MKNEKINKKNCVKYLTNNVFCHVRIKYPAFKQSEKYLLSKCNLSMFRALLIIICAQNFQELLNV